MNGMTNSRIFQFNYKHRKLYWILLQFSCSMLKVFNIVHSRRFKNKTTQSKPPNRYTHSTCLILYVHTQVMITTNYESFVKQLEAHGFPSFYFLLLAFSKNVFLLLPLLLDSQKTCFMFALIAIALILASLVVGRTLFSKSPQTQSKFVAETNGWIYFLHV